MKLEKLNLASLTSGSTLKIDNDTTNNKIDSANGSGSSCTDFFKDLYM